MCIKQTQDESPLDFITRVTTLARQIDVNMAEEEIMQIALRGFRGTDRDHIIFLENDTIESLRTNLRKLEKKKKLDMVSNSETLAIELEILKREINTMKSNERSKENVNFSGRGNYVSHDYKFRFLYNNTRYSAPTPTYGRGGRGRFNYAPRVQNPNWSPTFNYRYAQRPPRFYQQSPSHFPAIEFP
jgi:hypothetical protein